MLKLDYIEDVFSAFIEHCASKNLTLDSQDDSPAQGFYNLIHSGNRLTKNQANFIIKILQKYKNLSKMSGFDYSNHLVNPVWSQEFRILDMTKKLFVEKDNEGQLWICLKFPFALKEQFEKEILPKVKDHGFSIWDQERKIRKLKLHSYDLIQINDFAEWHGMDIDDSFLMALGEFEEIWQNYEKIAPFSYIANDNVFLENANQDSLDYFSANKTGKITDDLLLAKSMGYYLAKKPENLAEKIANVEETRFYINDVKKFFELYKNITGNVVIILDKSSSTETWIKNFCKTSENFGVKSEEIRICFRLDKHEDNGFNHWIKTNGYGGKVADGRILIFQGKPAKWLFSENISVKLIITNSLFPPMSGISQAWIDSHPCVCYMGDIKAAHVKEKKIVEL